MSEEDDAKDDALDWSEEEWDAWEEDLLEFHTYPPEGKTHHTEEYEIEIDEENDNE